ncbi:EAL domain-containing protein [Thiomicrorhabdus sp. ZW0627]|uniref:EAL domain-containing protein n=1 Tax=Thiomicrorhabdus sp. ZW0627 TaxID=3039774 RepID=UPI0024372CFC|nr:EAL domain-containing protein [Thiomicrorhabdus sp. ZW0627]MDG6774580.1 EAL domain-containing protein [Thiomicrorhabdus sp. ZW0627]
MWRSLSIRTQLFLLTSLMLLGITIITLSLAYFLDQKERKELAIELSQTLNKAMSHDMLKAVISDQTDVYSDLSFRLSQFESVDQVILYDENKKAIFEYARKHRDKYNRLIEKATPEPRFEGEDLYVKHPLIIDEHRFGDAIYIVDMQDLTTQLNQHLTYLIIAFPLELLIGFFLTLWLSRRYSKPFETLAQAMKESEPTQNRYPVLETQSKNEIKSLFDGFNQMMSQISDTTQQMRYQSEHDLLTGLYNRYYLESQLGEALKDSNDNTHVLIHIDLDQFKLINDTASYEAGDELLKMIALECQNGLPENALMARTDGDDFYILLRNTHEAQGLEFARQYLKGLSDFRFSWQGQAFSVSASVGVVVFQPFAYTIEELFKASSNALYAAKASGRNKLYLFHPEDDLSSRRNQEVITAAYIKEALADGPSRFQLYAQAIVPLQKQSEQFSYEILLRLWDGENNLIPPDSFLPTAERYQLMAEIDGFVLWQYLTQVTEHPEHLNQLHSVHINLAGSSLNHPDFQARVKKAVQNFNFPWYKLDLELTETSAVGNFNQAKTFIEWLKNIGIGLALDDFGTGMSSFEYLKSLPFDVIKIDGSFVKDMHKDPSDKAVIRYIQEISALRNQETVAEYVETEQDVLELTRIGITYGQGYFLGKPKPLTDWLDNS